MVRLEEWLLELVFPCPWNGNQGVWKSLKHSIDPCEIEMKNLSYSFKNLYVLVYMIMQEEFPRKASSFWWGRWYSSFAITIFNPAKFSGIILIKQVHSFRAALSNSVVNGSFNLPYSVTHEIYILKTLSYHIIW